MEFFFVFFPLSLDLDFVSDRIYWLLGAISSIGIFLSAVNYHRED
jgi:hypothetical protein